MSDSAGTEVRFLLHHNQLWVHRGTLIQWLRSELEIVQANRLPYTMAADDARESTLVAVILALNKLDPNDPKAETV